MVRCCFSVISVDVQDSTKALMISCFFGVVPFVPFVPSVTWTILRNFDCYLLSGVSQTIKQPDLRRELAHKEEDYADVLTHGVPAAYIQCPTYVLPTFENYNCFEELLSGSLYHATAHEHSAIDTDSIGKWIS